MITGFYYLLHDGRLVYRRGTVAPAPDSEIECVWPFDPDHAWTGWSILIEATALDALAERVDELAIKWKFDNATTVTEYAHYMQAYTAVPFGVMVDDFGKFIACAQGFREYGEGSDPLRALADLCRRMGFENRVTTPGGLMQLVGRLRSGHA